MRLPCLVQGNYIDTNAAGTGDLGNGKQGVSIAFAPNNVIGGTVVGARNVIAGNDRDGVAIFSATGNRVQGNSIGLGATGAGLRNSWDGVALFSNASNNTIGGTVAGATNLIVSTLDGVFVESGVRNAIRRNRIWANGGLGVDLFPDGKTNNDVGDGDPGANTLQNFPILTNVTSTATSTTISGTLNSTANTIFTIDLFRNLVCDPSGNGEGQHVLTSTNVTTNGSGNAAFTVTVSPRITAGW